MQDWIKKHGVSEIECIVLNMSAPINFQWSFDNPSVGFRAPDNEPKSMRVENRLASSDVNPYLAIATSLACGYIGMKKGLKPTEPRETSAYNEPARLSRDWYRALERLSDSRSLRDALGDAFVRVYVAVKEIEFNNFMNAISPWEREHLLFKV